MILSLLREDSRLVGVQVGLRMLCVQYFSEPSSLSHTQYGQLILMTKQWVIIRALQHVSVSLDDRADERVHLVHVDAGPEEPHAEHSHECQTPGQSINKQARNERIS